MTDVQQPTTTKERMQGLTVHAMKCFQGIKNLVVAFIEEVNNLQVQGSSVSTEMKIKVANTAYNHVMKEKHKCLVDFKEKLVGLGFTLGEGNMLPGESVDAQEVQSEEDEDKDEDEDEEDNLSGALVGIGQHARGWEENFFSQFGQQLECLQNPKNQTKNGYTEFVSEVNGGPNPEQDTIAMATDYFRDLQGDLGIPWDYHISSSEGQEEDSSSSEEEEEDLEEDSSDGQDSDEESVTDEVGEDNLVTP